jgi:hypothetical protein
MSKIRSAVALAAAVAGVAAGAVLTAAPASAATAPCPANYYCFYQNSNYNRQVSGWHLNYNSTASGSFLNPPSSSGDKRSQLSSIINNGNRTICVYNHRAVIGDKLIVKVGPYHDFPDLADVPDANDKADFWRIGGC